MLVVLPVLALDMALAEVVPDGQNYTLLLVEAMAVNCDPLASIHRNQRMVRLRAMVAVAGNVARVDVVAVAMDVALVPIAVAFADVVPAMARGHFDLRSMMVLVMVHVDVALLVVAVVAVLHFDLDSWMAMVLKVIQTLILIVDGLIQTKVDEKRML